MSDGRRIKATVVSLTKKKGMSWGMADLRTVYCSMVSFPTLPAQSTRGHPHHLLWADLGLLGLAGDESRACHGGGADSRGGAEGSPGKGTEETGVHDGLSGLLRVSALLRGSNGGVGAFERGN